MTESIAVASNAASSANTSGVTSASAAAKKKSSPSKVAKSSTKSPKKKSGPANHPKYSEMIKKALTALNDRGGSSKHAILKYIMANYHIDQANSNNHLRYALKAGLKSGTLKQAKGIGAAGSFKLGAEKKKSASGKSKTAAKKPKTGTKNQRRQQHRLRQHLALKQQHRQKNENVRHQQNQLVRNLQRKQNQLAQKKLNQPHHQKKLPKFITLNQKLNQ